jgi:LAO/AO transport system kinase
MLAGEKKSLAELISLIENDSRYLPEIMETLRPHLGKAYCIGVTGPPGAGKSTLVDKLTKMARGKGLSVGIIAVDPSSLISGGAVLGDRIRMQQHYLDEGVFIRSMASRGSYGGLSRAVAPTVQILDAFGKDIIIVETIGVGQTELGIREVAHVVVLVLVPGYGDSIQLMKAGLLEVADIIVVNKADQGDAERLANELRTTLMPRTGGLERTIVTTQAVNNIGIEELYRQIDKRRERLIK